MLNKAGIPLAAWGLLGFYRGTQYYQFKHNTDLKQYEEKKKLNSNHYSSLEKPVKYYSIQFAVGVWGSCVYIMPLIGFIPVIKEIYRLEINLRGIKDKQDNAAYYDLLMW